jgi:hypothetical protein
MSALAGDGLPAVMAAATWSRYSYLLELSEVMAHGPSYDPVTRMRSHSETGQLVGDVFFQPRGRGRARRRARVCIANLYALENLHGRAAFNHCAVPLRRPPAPLRAADGGDGAAAARTASCCSRAAWTTCAAGAARAPDPRRPRRARVAEHQPRARAAWTRARTTWIADVGIGVLPPAPRCGPRRR